MSRNWFLSSNSSGLEGESWQPVSSLSIARSQQCFFASTLWKSCFWAALLSFSACQCGAPVDGEPTNAALDGGRTLLADGGSSKPADGGGSVVVAGIVSIVISPDVVDEVLLQPLQSFPFQVTGTMANGNTIDLSALAVLELGNRRLGNVDSGVFFPVGIGGVSSLTARVNDLSVSASITLHVRQSFSGDDVDLSSAEELLGNATESASRNSTLYYPNDDVLLPPNLGAVEIHFSDEGTSTYAIRFYSDVLDVKAYTSCDGHNGGCIFTPSPALWAAISNTSRGGSLQVQVIALFDDDTEPEKATSGSISVNLAAVDVEGALYYWTTTRRAIMRVDFGALGNEPEQFFPEGDGNNGPCFGCHALSPDGFRMSLSQNGQWQGELTLLDVRTQGRLVEGSAGIREQFQAWNPSSTQFAAIYGDGDPVDQNLRIRDGNDASLIEEIPVGSEISHPHWSPVEDRIVFTVVTQHFSSQRPGRGGLSFVQKNNGVWSAPQELLAPEDGVNRYTPVYAPDGTFLVFNESQCAPGEIYNADCDADADDNARMFALSTDGQQKVELAGANRQGVLDDSDDLANTFPRWAPFTDALAFNEEGRPTGRIMWLTFSSRRRYGLRDAGSKQLLWMVGVDPEKARAGLDGSFTAFALPFQDLTTSNHMAQWARNFVELNPDAGIYIPEQDAGEICINLGDVCELGEACCDGFCATSTESVVGVCLQGSCVPAGETCSPASGGCCNGGLCLNIGEGVGVCQGT